MAAYCDGAAAALTLTTTAAAAATATATANVTGVGVVAQRASAICASRRQLAFFLQRAPLAALQAFRARAALKHSSKRSSRRTSEQRGVEMKTPPPPTKAAARIYFRPFARAPPPSALQVDALRMRQVQIARCDAHALAAACAKSAVETRYGRRANSTRFVICSRGRSVPRSINSISVTLALVPLRGNDDARRRLLTRPSTAIATVAAAAHSSSKIPNLRFVCTTRARARADACGLLAATARITRLSEPLEA